METSREIRLNNLHFLVEQFRTRGEFLAATNMSPAQLSQLLTANSSSGQPFRALGDKLARRLEIKLQLEQGWFDTPQEGTTPHLKLSANVPSRMSAESAGSRGIEQTSVDVGHLTLLQRAVLEALIKMATKEILTDRMCVELLDTWKDHLD
jgi:hypothetical protein